MDKTCTGVNFDGLLYQMCKGTTRSVAVGYTCFTKGGQLHTYKGYTWDERKNCAISSDYYDGVTYRGISQAMVRCAGSHDCNGINYDGGNSFRLMTGYTPTKKAGSTCYIQGSKFRNFINLEKSVEFINQTNFIISALASAQGLITHTTLRRFCQPVYETNYVLPCETHMMMMMMMMMMGPDVFLERIIRPFLNQSS